MKQLIENKVEELLSGQFCLSKACLRGNQTVFTVKPDTKKPGTDRFWEFTGFWKGRQYGGKSGLFCGRRKTDHWRGRGVGNFCRLPLGDRYWRQRKIPGWRTGNLSCEQTDRWTYGTGYRTILLCICDEYRITADCPQEWIYTGVDWHIRDHTGRKFCLWWYSRQNKILRRVTLPPSIFSDILQPLHLRGCIFLSVSYVSNIIWITSAFWSVRIPLNIMWFTFQ